MGDRSVLIMAAAPAILAPMDGNNSSWNFHFRREILDWELEDLSGLLGILDTCSFSNASDKRVWLNDLSGSFSWAFFLPFLTRSTSTDIEVKDPTEVQGFFLAAALDKLNTCDNLQKGQPNKASSPNVRIMCLNQEETGAHLFLHWRLLDLFGGNFLELWLRPAPLQIHFYPFFPYGEGWL